MTTRILIVDDEDDWRNIIALMSGSLGYAPEVASSLNEATQKIQTAYHEGNPFRVVTLDVGFVVGQTRFQGGKQLLKQIKAQYADTACVMISGSEGITPDTVLDLRDEYGLDYYIQKDRLEPDLLRRAILRATERVNHPDTSPAGKNATRAAANQPKVFISYRRSISWGQARAIANSLYERGGDVFLDLDRLKQGNFEEKLAEEIKNRDFFVPILSTTTLESEWVQHEISQAFTLGKTIIPLLVDGFSLYNVALPLAIKKLGTLQAIEMKPEFYDASLDKLLDYITAKS
ncbi:MAG: TIR domain-containing protein [Anaerolineae bacterium]|nr:TIR domain-containing protein [Anaerolineae bacterium]